LHHSRLRLFWAIALPAHCARRPTGDSCHLDTTQAERITSRAGDHALNMNPELLRSVTGSWYGLAIHADDLRSDTGRYFGSFGSPVRRNRVARAG
jgi:hypothetical protein